MTRWHEHPGVRSGGDLTLGERAADRLRNVMGSWPFVFGFLGTMVTWAILNTVILDKIVNHDSFDPFPYVLLNLCLSAIGGIQGAILLIAAKRADAVTSEMAVHQLKMTEALVDMLNDNTTLTNAIKEDTTLLQELHRHIQTLTPLAGEFDA